MNFAKQNGNGFLIVQIFPFLFTCTFHFDILLNRPNFLFCSNFLFCWNLLLFSPEFSYRPGLSVLSEDAITNNSNSAPTHGAGGPPNRPLPPTPDDDDQGDRTLIMKRVSFVVFFLKFYIFVL